MRSVSSTDADRLIFAASPVNSFFCGLVLAVHPEGVCNGARRLRRFNLSTPLRSWIFSVLPIRTLSRAEARAPTNTNNMGTHDVLAVLARALRIRAGSDSPSGLTSAIGRAVAEQFIPIFHWNGATAC
jgi:hypothetical protein